MVIYMRTTLFGKLSRIPFFQFVLAPSKDFAVSPLASLGVNQAYEDSSLIAPLPFKGVALLGLLLLPRPRRG